MNGWLHSNTVLYTVHIYYDTLLVSYRLYTVYTEHNTDTYTSTVR